MFPDEEQPSLSEDQSSPVAAEPDPLETVEIGGSATIINGNVEIHEHRHEHTHLYGPSARLEANLTSHEISREWLSRDVEAENLRRREELLRDLHTKQPVDPYCEQKRLEHEARVRQIQQHMQGLIER